MKKGLRNENGITGIGLFFVLVIILVLYLLISSVFSKPEQEKIENEVAEQLEVDLGEINHNDGNRTSSKITVQKGEKELELNNTNLETVEK